MKTSYRHLVQIALGTCTAASKENLSRRSCAQFSTEIFAEGTCRIIPGISSSGDHLQWTPCFHCKGRSSPASLQPLMILVFFHLPFRILTMQTGWNWNSWWFSGCPFFSFIIEVQEFSIFGMELFDDYVRDWALAKTLAMAPAPDQLLHRSGRFGAGSHAQSAVGHRHSSRSHQRRSVVSMLGGEMLGTDGNGWNSKSHHFIRVLKMHFIFGLLAVSLRLLHSLNSPGGLVTWTPKGSGPIELEIGPMG